MMIILIRGTWNSTKIILVTANNTSNYTSNITFELTGFDGITPSMILFAVASTECVICRSWMIASCETCGNIGNNC